MGHALTGIADDASVVYYNPAGLILNNMKKWDGEGYLYFNFVKFEYQDNGRPDPTTDKADLFYYVPGFFLCTRFERVALGSRLYVPHGGGGVDYDDFQGSGYRFQCLTGFSAFTPAAAFKLTDNFSVGAGFAITESMEIDINTGYTYGLEKEHQSRTYDLDTFIVLIGMRYKR